MMTIRSEVTGRMPGILYLVLAVTGFYAPFVLRQFGLSFDAAEWYDAVLRTTPFLVSGIMSLYLMNIAWLLLAFSLFNAFRKSCRRASVLLLLSVIAGSVLVFIIIFLYSTPLFLISTLAGIPEAAKSVWMERTHFMFTMGTKATIMAYLFYSVWLFPFAFLFLNDRSISKLERIVLVVSLCIAGTGYMADFILFHITPLRDTMKVTGFTFIGEVVVLLRLLVRGVRVKEESR